MNNCCVYAHLKPTGEVFYIGKAATGNEAKNESR